MHLNSIRYSLYNKVRVAFISEYLIKDKKPENRHQMFQELRALDVGSGGGLLCESLGRLGCQVLGIDPAENSVKIAREHLCHDEKLMERVKYEQTTIENLAPNETMFDFATSMEVIEHVDNQSLFVENIVKRIRPGGLLFMSTMAKTFESYVISKVMAEDILGMIPQGTHDWNKFIDPEELQGIIEDTGCVTIKIQGVAYDPINNKMINRNSNSNNYMLVAKKV